MTLEINHFLTLIVNFNISAPDLLFAVDIKAEQNYCNLFSAVVSVDLHLILFNNYKGYTLL